MISISEEFVDFIAFLDDNEEKREWYVKIIEASHFVTFVTKDGNTVSIPSNRVLKIKKKGAVLDDK